MKDAITYANEAGFFSFNVVGWKAEFERLIEAVRADALAELVTVKESLTAQDHSAGTGNKVSDHIADAGTLMLTTEQAQQIEEALLSCEIHDDGEIRYSTFDNDKIWGAIDTIRKARAQERETVVCESCGETIHECQIAGETESGGTACADCCVAFWIDHVAHLEEQHGINPAANFTLTTEQAQQIEEALDELRYANNTDIAKTKYYKAISTIRAAREQEQAEQDLDTCPGCGGVADNGHDREFPPNPYYCTKCSEQAEPEQYPTYGFCPICGSRGISRERRINGNDTCANGHSYASNLALHIAPEKQAEQEPVAIVDEIRFCLDGRPIFNAVGKAKVGQKLYAAPGCTKDLTDAELDALWYGNTEGGWRGLFRAVIAADREKNK